MKISKLGIVAALVLLFLWLGWNGGPANAFDNDIIARLAAMRHGAPGLTRAIIMLTQFGSVYVTIGSALVASLLLWRHGEQLRAKLLAGTVALERIAADSIKLLYDRPRPQFDLHPVVTSSSSYPSGHSANSMTAFVALALFAAPARLRRPALAAAIVGGVAIGLTRPYLGVHWPSDTIGGWTLAAMFLLSAHEAGDRLGAFEAQHHIVGRHRTAVGEDESARGRLGSE